MINLNILTLFYGPEESKIVLKTPKYGRIIGWQGPERALFECRMLDLTKKTNGKPVLFFCNRNTCKIPPRIDWAPIEHEQLQA